MHLLVYTTPTLALPLKGREANSFPFRGKEGMGVVLSAASIAFKLTIQLQHYRRRCNFQWSSKRAGFAPAAA